LDATLRGSIQGDWKLPEALVISIVDDDRIARDAIRELVQSLGYRTAVFPSAEQFLESGSVEETACVITDLQMPGMSGFDLQVRLRDSGFDTPVIFVSGFPEERHRTRALDAGAVGFLSKPFEERSLVECLNAALKGGGTLGPN
jgi:FixJ family two-component response regulator